MCVCVREREREREKWGLRPFPLPVLCLSVSLSLSLSRISSHSLWSLFATPTPIYPQPLSHHFSVGRVLVLRPVPTRPLPRDPPARRAARVNDRGRPGAAPRGVVEEIVRRAALGARVDRALLRVADRRREALLGPADRLLAHHFVGAAVDVTGHREEGRPGEGGDRATRGTVAFVAPDRAPVREPETGLAVGPGPVRARAAKNARGLERDRREGQGCKEVVGNEKRMERQAC